MLRGGRSISGSDSRPLQKLILYWLSTNFGNTRLSLPGTYNHHDSPSDGGTSFGETLQVCGGDFSVSCYFFVSPRLTGWQYCSSTKRTLRKVTEFVKAEMPEHSLTNGSFVMSVGKGLHLVERKALAQVLTEVSIPSVWASACDTVLRVRWICNSALARTRSWDRKSA